MQVTRLSPAFSDDRGSITDLLEGIDVQHIAHFTCASGSTRGNHYHKTATSFIYVLTGGFRVRYRVVGQQLITATYVPAGYLIQVDPLEAHELTATKDSSFLMMTSGPDGGRQYLTDTVREAV